MAVNLEVRRSPAQLRQLLEVRTRRQAQTYDWPTRRQALVEMRALVDAAIRHGDREPGEGNE